MDKRIEKLIKKAMEIEYYGHYWSNISNPNCSTFLLLEPHSYIKLFRLIREKRWFNKQEIFSLDTLLRKKDRDNFLLGIEIIKAKNNDK